MIFELYGSFYEYSVWFATRVDNVDATLEAESLGFGNLAIKPADAVGAVDAYGDPVVAS